MSVDDQGDGEAWRRKSIRKHVGTEILWKCLCLADAKKARLKQGLESDFSGEARQETLVLWGGIHPNVRSPKALLKTFSKPTFLFFLLFFIFFFLLSPSRLQKPGSALRSTSMARSILCLVFALLWNQDSGQELCLGHIMFRTCAGVTLPVNEGQSEVGPLCHQKVTLVQRNGKSKKRATISIDIR